MNITILGGGFGGVKAALELSKQKNTYITLISDKPDFQYFPALYGTATGNSHLESWVPLGRIFAGKSNINVIIDKITKIDPKEKTLTSAIGNVFDYDNLIIALGTVTTYFGIEGLDQFTFGIKSESEIRELKEHLYREMAEEREVAKQYVVIGGGPTGVELSAALGAYIKRLRKKYNLPYGRVGITLIEAAPRLLPRNSELTSKMVYKRLRKLGVNIMLDKKVESADDKGLMVSGKPLESQTIIWTSGVANNPFFADNSEHFELSKNGRVVVNKYMRTKDGIHVIGDNAFTPYSGLAQTALHDAVFVAKNFARRQKGHALKAYKPVAPPNVVPVGDKWAAFEWHWIKLYGWVAYLIRRAADAIGYHDVLPLGQALGSWHAQTIQEEDYFTPTPPALEK